MAEEIKNKNPKEKLTDKELSKYVIVKRLNEPNLKLIAEKLIQLGEK